MLESVGKIARDAADILATVSASKKNQLLACIAHEIRANSGAVLAANSKDMEEAKQQGLSPAMLDRLLLTGERLEQIAADVLHVARLADPVGQTIDGGVATSGLRLERRRVPLGVVGVIYEARPNVTVDVATLCLKTGNASILRGGKETRHSNAALVQCIKAALTAEGLPEESVQLIESADRSLVTALLQLDGYVDMIIPRGGVALQQLCKEKATIPVIFGGIGVCHIFVEATADQQQALPLLENAKVQRPSVCNAVETLLVDAYIAEEFLPKVVQRLAPHAVRFHACPKSLPILAAAGGTAVPVREEEYSQEWLTLDLNVHVIEGIEEALVHIRKHGSGHSDAILTQDMRQAKLFVDRVDTASVYVNASTRFTDGGEFGLGAEVAVSTQKLHARGPMGLDALTTYKWIGTADYLCRG